MHNTTILIKSRFNGPPDSANGGYTSGIVAKHLDGDVKVRLRRPPPLDQPLSLKYDADMAVLLSDGNEIVRAERSSLALELPPCPTGDEIMHAPDVYPSAEQHALSSCFVCGPARADGDGLRVFSVPIPRYQCVASIWKPSASLCDDSGLIPTELLWAALDCPGYFAHREPQTPMLLGTMTASIKRRPQPGLPLRVVGWQTGVEGRKYYSGTAILDYSGEVYGKSAQIWIKLK